VSLEGVAQRDAARDGEQESRQPEPGLAPADVGQIAGCGRGVAAEPRLAAKDGDEPLAHDEERAAHQQRAEM